MRIFFFPFLHEISFFTLLSLSNIFPFHKFDFIFLFDPFFLFSDIYSKWNRIRISYVHLERYKSNYLTYGPKKGKNGNRRRKYYYCKLLLELNMNITQWRMCCESSSYANHKLWCVQLYFIPKYIDIMNISI